MEAVEAVEEEAEVRVCVWRLALSALGSSDRRWGTNCNCRCSRACRRPMEACAEAEEGVAEREE